jgi:hypothetical protein
MLKILRKRCQRLKKHRGAIVLQYQNEISTSIIEKLLRALKFENMEKFVDALVEMYED